MESFNTIVVGAGQAGLATSYFLRQAGHEHLVLEKAARPTDVWESGRWDSFSLVTPNWALRMPGAAYDGPEPDAFMTKSDLITYFDQYVGSFKLPVQCDTRVESIEPNCPSGFLVNTSMGDLRAENVVIATGLDQLPGVPDSATAISPKILQLHSCEYRSPEALPSGAVLVVGSAQSGAQICEELYLSGRQVFHSIGSTGRAPRRYRGRDVFDWLYNYLKFFDLPPEKFPMPIEEFSPPHLSGGNGGHSLNLHQFARDGVRLLGHFQNAADARVTFQPDLYECLAKADGFEKQSQQMVDGYIEATGIDAPLEELPHLTDGFAQPVIEEIDLVKEGITTILWATGYRYDFSLVKMPVFDQKGFPVLASGITSHRGLSFVGMPWMPSIKSGILAGVGEHAQYITNHILGGSKLNSTVAAA